MTSHYRHRRTSVPGILFNQLEPGEIAVNTANRQLTVGDDDPASVGSPLPMLAVRVFDARSMYVAGEFVIQGGAFYRCKNDITSPAAFDPEQWDKYSDDGTIRDYINGETTGKVARAGDTMVGPLVLAADPVNDLEPATKRYTDAAIGGVVHDYQAADQTITANYLSKTGGILTGQLTLAADPVTDLQAATRQYVDRKGTGLPDAPSDTHIYARQNGAWSDINPTLTALVPKTRRVDGGGLASGGGDLTADRTITVTAATQAEAEAGTDNTKAMTPLTTAEAIAVLQLFTAIASQAEAETGTNNTKGMTPLRVRQAIIKYVGDVAKVWSTGDIKLTIDNVPAEGWVLMNDGSIGSAASGATARANADAEPLYTLLWNKVSQSYAPVSGGRGASPAADFAANKTIALTKVLGRALAVAGAGAGLTPRPLGGTDGYEYIGLTADQLAPHTHAIRISDAQENAGAPFPPGVEDMINYNSMLVANQYVQPHASQPYLVMSAGSGNGHYNVQPTTYLNVMIRL